MKTCKRITFVLFLTGLFSFTLLDTQVYEFSYPKRKHTAITLSAEGFKEFTKTWQGADYYYSCETMDGLVCSVLYYKLNDDERQSLVEFPKKLMGGDEISPAYPFAYFSNYSTLKKYETSNEGWGQPTDDFMFRQCDITEFQGTKVAQKHMYGYCMADKDLFVSVHLSKTGYTSSDSLKMRQILASLVKKK
jgi:hypothetical protein